MEHMSTYRVSPRLYINNPAQKMQQQVKKKFTGRLSFSPLLRGFYCINYSGPSSRPWSRAALGDFPTCHCGGFPFVPLRVLVRTWSLTLGRNAGGHSTSRFTPHSGPIRLRRCRKALQTARIPRKAPLEGWRGVVVAGEEEAEKV